MFGCKSRKLLSKNVAIQKKQTCKANFERAVSVRPWVRDRRVQMESVDSQQEKKKHFLTKKNDIWIWLSKPIKIFHLSIVSTSRFICVCKRTADVRFPTERFGTRYPKMKCANVGKAFCFVISTGTHLVVHGPVTFTHAPCFHVWWVGSKGTMSTWMEHDIEGSVTMLHLSRRVGMSTVHWSSVTNALKLAPIMKIWIFFANHAKRNRVPLLWTEDFFHDSLLCLHKSLRTGGTSHLFSRAFTPNSSWSPFSPLDNDDFILKASRVKAMFGMDFESLISPWYSPSTSKRLLRSSELKFWTCAPSVCSHCDDILRKNP